MNIETVFSIIEANPHLLFNFVFDETDAEILRQFNDAVAFLKGPFWGITPLTRTKWFWSYYLKHQAELNTKSSPLSEYRYISESAIVAAALYLRLATRATLDSPERFNPSNTSVCVRRDLLPALGLHNQSTRDAA